MTGQVRVPPSGDQPAGGVHVEEGSRSARTAELDELTARTDALQAQLDERTGDLQRISAEYTNYRRRVERDRQLVIALAKAQVAGELLTVLDDIERAQAHGDLSGAFKVVADKLVTGLQAHGLEPFGATGDGFDPDVHEAVQHATSPDVHEPTVTAVLRRGYRFGERVLRPAMVAVTDAEPSTVMSRDAAESREGGDAEPCGDAEPRGGTAQMQEN
ncbi:MAG TPA: nucleotide exchange factor GrpE [Pseudonocardiaceae bacterium]